MGIALLTLAELFTPLQSLANRWIPTRSRRDTVSAGLRYVAVRPGCSTRASQATHAATRPQRAVRVVRIVQPDASAGAPGRLVISGRMADVCAELDRLAALEAANSAVADARRLH